MMNPFIHTHYSFEGQRADETVHIFMHRHPIVILVQLIVTAILSLAPIVLSFFADWFDVQLGIAHASGLLFVLFYMVLWLSLLRSATMYLLDSWVVTNHRIINNTQEGFFNRTVSELELVKIQDVSVKIDGLLPTFLNYGDVEIQTAGTINKFVFRDIPRPKEVKDEVMRLVALTRERGPLV